MNKLAYLIPAALLFAVPASAALTPTWNDYRWARSGMLQIQLGDNLTSQWDPFLRTAASEWSVLNNIDFTVTAGATRPSNCSPVAGTVQACNARYGRTGWLGLASVWLTDGYITQATVKLNDTYYNLAQYNSSAWRQSVTCQEVGHTLGLAHADENFTNANLGTCMDYTNDPSGTKGTNGTLNNLHPYGGDYDALNALYATPGGTQLASTKPRMLATFGVGVDGTHFHTLTALPEPGTWALLLTGFGGIGLAMRRGRARPPQPGDAARRV